MEASAYLLMLLTVIWRVSLLFRSNHYIAQEGFLLQIKNKTKPRWRSRLSHVPRLFIHVMIMDKMSKIPFNMTGGRCEPGVAVNPQQVELHAGSPFWGRSEDAEKGGHEQLRALR